MISQQDEKSSPDEVVYKESPWLRFTPASIYQTVISAIGYAILVIWGFTQDNFSTFAVPGMAFGIFGALSVDELVDGQTNVTVAQILGRVVALLAFNWVNLAIFDLSNQRSPESVAEDKINKPWRPIPTGKITMQQTRRALLLAVPLVMAMNRYLGVCEYGLLIHIVVWLYNDLGGGDEIIIRDLLISVGGYSLFNGASLEIAACQTPGQGGCHINQRGLTWTKIIGAIIFTTMQIQDLKDEEGDKSRNRRTVVLVLGHFASRFSIALFVIIWSVVCAEFWRINIPVLVVLLLLAATIAWMVMFQRTHEANTRAWKVWCLWLVVLYLLPLLSGGLNLRRATL